MIRVKALLWIGLIAGASVEWGWIEQPIDHYLQAGKFKQRFLKMGNGSADAVLVVGGEETLTSNHLYKSLVRNISSSLGVVAYALEHRYYGASYPTANLSTHNLRHLSSRQALLDIGSFMRQKAKRWVVIGGSYGGTLAVLAKAHYPDLVIGAVASSSPIHMKLNFFEYDLHVQKALRQKGGQACLDFHHRVTEDIDREISNGKLKKLKAQFNCKGSFLDALTFVANIVQYAHSGHIAKYCHGLNPKATPEQRIAEFSRRFKAHLGTQTCQKTYNLSFLTDESLGGNTRQWYYQCCTEFGFWQTAPEPPTPTIRSILIDVNFYSKYFCQRIFGKDLPKRNHPKILSLENILMTNGELDPWATISTSNITIVGASHSIDLDLLDPLDPPAVKKVNCKSSKP
ncbi:hypothetical protein DSO57_1017258 [Entomophthora muscae]|uniref:Uncharacterized protein n=1 Tax=Entomophthora muscae TaxID=34485 RepID=A0ACC2UEC6_9FUNG|nr:hypothetical protein DSO57_1017258 [Entomophthora muscae]